MMETRMERQRSLKKLHFYIANYAPTDEEKMAVRSAQIELKEKIQAKFKKSNSNQTYVFPKKYPVQQEYSNTVQIVDLKQPYYQDNLQTAQRPKLKIKLARPKQQTTINLEQLQSSFQQSNKLKTDKSTLAFLNTQKSSNPNSYIQGRLKTQFHAEKDNQAVNNTLNLRMKTQHSGSKDNYFTRAIKIVDTDLSIHGSLQRANSGQRSKSKLNMLTKSYMNMKTSILDKEKTQQTCNTIRSNDYKLMPNKRQQNSVMNKSSILGYRNNTNKLEQCQSTRVLNNCTNQLNRLANIKTQQRSNQKMKFNSQKPPQVAQQDRKFFKVK